MPRNLLLLALFLSVALAVHAAVPELLPELRFSKPESWLGKERTELIGTWGEPSKTKRNRDGVLLVFERRIMVGLSYDGSATNMSYRREKDDDGKARMVQDGQYGTPTEAVFKKARFKFWLDDAGRVVKVKFPESAAVDPNANVHVAPAVPDGNSTPYTP
jgi:hypothetical protein